MSQPSQRDQATPAIEAPWADSVQDVLRRLKVSLDAGLSGDEVKRRRATYGFNRLREMPRKSAWRILIDQFRSMIVALLAAAALLSFAFGHLMEGSAIVAVLVLNGLIGFVTEIKAVRSMEALHRMSDVTANVRRGGTLQSIPARELVPGDVVILEGGDIVSADLRIASASRLQADESALTGESAPVDKQLEPVAAEALLAERQSMLFKGTAVTQGSAEGLVVATGMRTELGRISALVAESIDEKTPLEMRLDQLGRKLVWLTLVIAAIVATFGIVAGRPAFLMIQTAIALAVAAIPEGLPIVATAALARGMWRLARRNALVNRLSAVETLGSTTVICTDKTGTLTENRMSVAAMQTSKQRSRIAARGGQQPAPDASEPSHDAAHDAAMQAAWRVGVLCNNATLDGERVGGQTAIGDPMELALLTAAESAGTDPQQMRQAWPEVREEAFDPRTKMMATYHRQSSQLLVAVKGAPEAVLEACSQERADDGDRAMDDTGRARWLDWSMQMAEQGLRVLAMAEKQVDRVEEAPYQGLTVLALVGFVDPPRDNVRAAIEQCNEAGIRVVMVTGDQAATAQYVASALGLIADGTEQTIEGKALKPAAEWTSEDRDRVMRAVILARVDPKQKLDLIALYQENGDVVAMTGDGVNDAPALKKSDIGIAMGQRGTQVAREAADMVLTDDSFATIAVAIEQGRVIFSNIRNFVIYLVSCNISEILVVTLASLFNAPMPILPLQILFLNLVTDVFPALALGAGEGDSTCMKKPPRDPKEPVLTRAHWLAIGGYGVLLTAVVLASLTVALIWLEMPADHAITVSFLTLGFAQLWHVFNLREAGSGFINNEITRNGFVWGAVAACSGLLIGAVYLPGIRHVLELSDPGPWGWLVILIMSLIPWGIGQLLKSIRRATR